MKIIPLGRGQIHVDADLFIVLLCNKLIIYAKSFITCTFLLFFVFVYILSILPTIALGQIQNIDICRLIGV
jgi:hypothetical protein